MHKLVNQSCDLQFLRIRKDVVYIPSSAVITSTCPRRSDQNEPIMHNAIVDPKRSMQCGTDKMMNFVLTTRNFVSKNEDLC